jgi:hypothetical protein
VSVSLLLASCGVGVWCVVVMAEVAGAEFHDFLARIMPSV